MESIRFLFWCCPLLSVDCFHKLCLSGNPSENSQAGWDVGNRMVRGYRFDMKWVCLMGSYAWGTQVFCSRNWAPPNFKPPPWTEHLNTSGITFHGTDSFHTKPITPGHPIPKISTSLTIFWVDTWKTEFVKTIHRQERTSSGKRSDGLQKKCSIELWIILLFKLLLCRHTVARYMERT